ncbi:MAG: hypothetical protein PUE63_08105 [Lachnospiraceae bacterium]|nr:hypothetical protein [Lachnospiraceae bacterium]
MFLRCLRKIIKGGKGIAREKDRPLLCHLDDVAVEVCTVPVEDVGGQPQIDIAEKEKFKGKEDLEKAPEKDLSAGGRQSQHGEVPFEIGKWAYQKRDTPKNSFSLFAHFKRRECL